MTLRGTVKGSFTSFTPTPATYGWNDIPLAQGKLSWQSGSCDGGNENGLDLVAHLHACVCPIGLGAAHSGQPG